MKAILIIQGHPRKDSFCDALEESYLRGCGKNADVQRLHLRDLRFDPILRSQNAREQPLEEDLHKAQQQITAAEHIVLVYPTWWGSSPALLKGFFDRAFVPGFAYSYRKNSMQWDKLLKGKTARIVTTMDAPSWYDWLVYQRSGMNQIQQATFAFCGIRTIGRNIHSMVRKSSQDTREKLLAAMQRMGTKDAG